MWLVGVYFFHTVGELCLSPVGLSTVTKLAPQRAVGQMMGVWFMATALGNFIGGQIATLFESFPLPWIFFSVFATTALMAGVLALMIKPIRALMGGVH
jgi:POT family proton-dependent oligopeptide transporter